VSGIGAMRRLALFVVVWLGLVGFALWRGTGVAHACDPVTGEGCNMTTTTPSTEPRTSPPTTESTTTTTTSEPPGTSPPTTESTTTTTTSEPPATSPPTTESTTTTTSEPPATSPPTTESTTTTTSESPVSTPTSSKGSGFPVVPVALGGGGGLLALAAAAGVAGVLSGSPPAPAAATDEPTTNFRVRMTGSLGISIGIIGGTYMNVEVQALGPDGEWSRSKRLTFIGGGLSVGLNVGVSGASDWEQITTTTRCRLKDFGGMGGIIPFPSYALKIPWLCNLSGGAGTLVNIGGPKATGNQHLNPDGGSGEGLTIIGVQPGYWFSRGR
jgi:hypothetical protein